MSPFASQEQGVRNDFFSFTSSEWRVVICLTIAIVTVITTSPTLVINWTSSHDLLFHLNRIRGIAHGLQSGLIPAQLYDTIGYGFGYSCGVCYPSLFLCFPALIMCMGFPLKMAYTLFVLLVNLATATIAYVAFKTVFRSRYAGLIACVLWTCAPYRLTNLLLRGAMGEYLALMLAPLIVLGLWRIFIDKSSKPGKGWILLGVAVAGVIYSHVLSVVLF